MTPVCQNCGPLTISPAQQVAGKITLAAAGATLGLKATKDPLVAVVCGLVGLWGGHEIDKRCPQCGAILQFADFIFGR
jgi:predicted RNase H-like nuclease